MAVTEAVVGTVVTTIVIHEFEGCTKWLDLMIRRTEDFDRQIKKYEQLKSRTSKAVDKKTADKLNSIIDKYIKNLKKGKDAIYDTCTDLGEAIDDYKQSQIKGVNTMKGVENKVESGINI